MPGYISVAMTRAVMDEIDSAYDPVPTGLIISVNDEALALSKRVIQNGKSLANTFTYASKATFLKRYSIGVRNPNWKSRLARAQAVSSDYIATHREYHRAYDMKCTRVTYPNAPILSQQRAYYDGYHPGFPVPLANCPAVAVSSEVSVQTDNYLRQKLLRKLERRDPQIDGLPYIVEWEKTKVLHRDILQATFDCLQSVYELAKHKFLMPGEWKHLAADISGLWLAWCFAIKPTLGDLVLAVEALAAAQVGRTSSLGARSETYTQVNPTKREVVTSLDSLVRTYRVTRSVTTYDASYKVLLRAVAQQNDVYRTHTLARRFLDLVNATTLRGVLSNFWEVIPFSWLLDYFYDISSMWNHDVIVLRDVLTACKTVTTRTEYTCWYEFSSLASYVVLENKSPGEYSFVVTQHERKVVDIPYFEEYRALPKWQIDLNPKRISYIISVIIQLFAKRRRIMNV